ncbi:hypothetical protein MIND_00824600 [Mycena indigotica]|uniref:Uncharacterized protein n=1 Tax=Mycena indigotica TaxID=2126181 RepID=A0A8H6SH97_9AGAR|nr:uncharacterized protein MIND_00824600 [Mycena indigotica]KAF7298770.1 hypothetical protein MIND_00824600 [Mycena indigotica]
MTFPVDESTSQDLLTLQSILETSDLSTIETFRKLIQDTLQARAVSARRPIDQDGDFPVFSLDFGGDLDDQENDVPAQRSSPDPWDDNEPSFNLVMRSTPRPQLPVSPGVDAHFDSSLPLPDLASVDESNFVTQTSFYHLPSFANVRNLFDYLTTTRIVKAFSEITGQVSSRPPRQVECNVPHRLEQLVYVPDLPSWIVEFMVEKRRENLMAIELTKDDLDQMNAGLRCANSCPIVRSEADVEYRVRAGLAHSVVEAMKKVCAWLSSDFCCHKGTAAGPGPTYAYTDLQIAVFLIEVKTLLSIAGNFILLLLRLSQTTLDELTRKHPNSSGFVFDFEYPSLSHLIDSPTQPVVQLWTQLSNTPSAYFAMGSSDEYTFFVVKDPVFSDRLYISPCLRSFPSLTGHEDLEVSQSDADTTKFASVVMFYTALLANDAELRAEFFERFAKRLVARDGLLHVGPDDVNQFATATSERDRPALGDSQGPDGSAASWRDVDGKMLAGVKYYYPGDGKRHMPERNSKNTDKGKGKAPEVSLGLEKIEMVMAMTKDRHFLAPVDDSSLQSLQTTNNVDIASLLPASALPAHADPELSISKRDRYSSYDPEAPASGSLSGTGNVVQSEGVFDEEQRPKKRAKRSSALKQPDVAPVLPATVAGSSTSTHPDLNQRHKLRPRKPRLPVSVRSTSNSSTSATGRKKLMTKGSDQRSKGKGKA